MSTPPVCVRQDGDPFGDLLARKEEELRREEETAAQFAKKVDELVARKKRAQQIREDARRRYDELFAELSTSPGHPTKLSELASPAAPKAIART